MSVCWSPLTKSPERFETFPTFSPDGRWLAFTLHKYGNFSIWHRDADIWMLDLERLGECSCEGGWNGAGGIRNGAGGGGCTKESSDCCAAWPATALNSDESESYHCWSSNGRWLVFSSRRDDGLFTRPYVAYIDSNGVARKPFMLPQRNPKEYYEDLMYSYNIPELMTGPVSVPARTMAKVLRESPGTDVGL